jgi:hypothetical protein
MADVGYALLLIGGFAVLLPALPEFAALVTNRNVIAWNVR